MIELGPAKINIVSLVLLCVYVCVSIVNLIFAFNENEHWRKITKPFCLIILIIAAIFWVPNSPFLYIGIALDLAGDILLIWKHKLKIFMIGSSAFLLGHICYIIQCLLICYQNLNWIFYVVVLFVLAIFYLSAYRPLYKIMKNRFLSVMGCIYVSTLIVLLITFFSACYVGYISYMLIAALGMISFCISDGLIIYFKFVKRVKRSEFFIMSTYLLAQLMIIAGFCLTLTSI